MSSFPPRVGVVFPHAALTSRAAVAGFARATVESGVDYVSLPNHDLGVDAGRHRHRLERDWPFPLGPGGRGVPYDAATPFHEPFTLAGFLAALAPGLDLVTGVVALPQLQTAAVARQAAELAVLTGGRFTLGVGAGWNRVEHEALGGDWPTRFSRLEEQIDVLRRLWSHDLVDFTGAHHRLDAVALPNRPPSGRVPVCIGSGDSDGATGRVGRLADGWMPQVVPGRGLEEGLDRVRTVAASVGRDASSISVYGVVAAGHGDGERIAVQAKRWRGAGATHIAVDLKGAADPLAGLASAVGAVRNV